MHKLLKNLIVMVVFLVLASILVLSVNTDTVYNPFTGKLDYIRTSNLSGENITADNFFGNINASYVQNEYWVNANGDLMTGNLFMNGNNITNIDYYNAIRASISLLIIDTGGSVNFNNNNATTVDCILFKSGGKICDSP